jgi:anti-sigma factor ChrR (cupin superfamily)
MVVVPAQRNQPSMSRVELDEFGDGMLTRAAPSARPPFGGRDRDLAAVQQPSTYDWSTHPCKKADSKTRFHMHRLPFVAWATLVAIVGSLLSSNAQQSSTRTEEDAIVAVINPTTDAFNRHDPAAWLRLATADAELITAPRRDDAWRRGD